MAGTGLLCLGALLAMGGGAGALPRSGLVPFGASRGDRALPEGDDESSEALSLAAPLPFYETRFGQLYVSLSPPGGEPPPRPSPRAHPGAPQSRPLPRFAAPRGAPSHVGWEGFELGPRWLQVQVSDPAGRAFD